MYAQPQLPFSHAGEGLSKHRLAVVWEQRVLLVERTRGTGNPPALPKSIKANPTLPSVSSVSLLRNGLVRVEMNPGREAFIQEMSKSVCMDLD